MQNIPDTIYLYPFEKKEEQVDDFCDQEWHWSDLPAAGCIKYVRPAEAAKNLALAKSMLQSVTNKINNTIPNGIGAEDLQSIANVLQRINHEIL